MNWSVISWFLAYIELSMDIFANCSGWEKICKNWLFLLCQIIFLVKGCQMLWQNVHFQVDESKIILEFLPMSLKTFKINYFWLKHYVFYCQWGL